MHDVATDGAEKPRGVQGAPGTSRWALASGIQNRALGLSSDMHWAGDLGIASKWTM